MANSAAQTDKNLAYLYDVEWQALRVSLLGKWNNASGFRDNCHRLYLYLDDCTIGSTEWKRRLWRIVNCMNAVMMGYNGQGDKVTDLMFRLREERKYYADRYALCDKNLGEWDWKKVENDLKKLHEDNRAKFYAILDNLERRKEFAKKKVGTLDYRKELQIFVDMMKNVDRGVI